MKTRELTDEEKLHIINTRIIPDDIAFVGTHGGAPKKSEYSGMSLTDMTADDVAMFLMNLDEYAIPIDPDPIPFDQQSFAALGSNVWVREKDSGAWRRVCDIDPMSVLLTVGWVKYQHLATEYEYSTDNGKTWQPCVRPAGEVGNG